MPRSFPLPQKRTRERETQFQLGSDLCLRLGRPCKIQGSRLRFTLGKRIRRTRKRGSPPAPLQVGFDGEKPCLGWVLFPFWLASLFFVPLALGKCLFSGGDLVFLLSFSLCSLQAWKMLARSVCVASTFSAASLRWWLNIERSKRESVRHGGMCWTLVARKRVNKSAGPHTEERLKTAWFRKCAFWSTGVAARGDVRDRGKCSGIRYV